MDLVMQVADRVLVIDYGQYLFEGAAGRGAGPCRRDRRLSRRSDGMTALARRGTRSSSPMAKRSVCRDLSFEVAEGRDRRADRRQRRRQVDDAARRRRRAHSAHRLDPFPRQRHHAACRRTRGPISASRSFPRGGASFRSSPCARTSSSAASSTATTRARCDRLIEKVFAMFPRLSERAAQNAGTLSGGEQQMLALGRAMMSEPQSAVPRRAFARPRADGGAGHLPDHPRHQCRRRRRCSSSSRTRATRWRRRAAATCCRPADHRERPLRRVAR